MGSETVALSLARDLLLEHDAVGDIASVQNDTAHVAVVAKVGEVRFEMPPCAGRVAHPEDDLLGHAVSLRVPNHLAVVVVDHVQEPAPEEVGFRTSDSRGHRPAHVPAAVVGQERARDRWTT